MTDLANVALAKVGCQSINSLLDTTNASAIACNNNATLCYLEVSRSAQWNCLLTPAVLVNIPQTPIAGVNPPIVATAWAPLTAYLANVFVTYGNYYYQVLFNYTSTKSFANDLTTGALSQTDQNTAFSLSDFQLNAFGGNLGAAYPSSWGYQYALPADFQYLSVLNDNEPCWDFDSAGGDDYQIMGTSLYTDDAQAVIQYVQSQPDTTRFDSMMANAFTLKLASAISTSLRQDGGKMEAAMIQEYERSLRTARTRNAGERQMRRFSAITSSRFTRARYGGIQG